MIQICYYCLTLLIVILCTAKICRTRPICHQNLFGTSATDLMNLELEEDAWYLAIGTQSCQEMIKRIDDSSQSSPSCKLDDDDDTLQRVQDNRVKRFVSSSPSWSFTDLKWKLHDPHDLFKKDNDFNVVRNTISHALWMWSRASHRSLQFTDLTHTNRTPDLDIYFARWDHGDYEPFDGRGGIVAHSGYPMHGRVHFDASELWTIKGVKGVDLRYVTLHELGHALGLRHSSKPRAIMHPIYKRSSGDIYLSEDDINGIRALYSQANPRPRHNSATDSILEDHGDFLDDDDHSYHEADHAFD